jgi:hypothetical protein
MNDALTARLENLERANRTWRRAAVALLALVAAIIGAGAVQGPQETIECKSLRLVDDRGATRVLMVSDSEKAGPLISFYDENQKSRLMLNINKTGSDGVPNAPSLKLSGTNGTGRVALFLDAAGRPHLVTYDETGKRLLNLLSAERR